MRKIFLYIISITCALSSPIGLADDDAGAKEYLVKAAFLYNFVKFVEWPPEMSVAQDHSAAICIMGSDPFGSSLETVAKKAASVQPPLILNIKRNVSQSEASKCNILFISNSDAGNVGSILAAVHHKPVLTVSEIKGFADKGGIIEMVKVEQNIGLFSKDKINLRINTNAAEDSHLRIDAQLLEIAAEIIK